jgi:predicted ATPase/DNA-binding CsgD family transcriptional regulator
MDPLADEAATALTESNESESTPSPHDRKRPSRSGLGARPAEKPRLAHTRHNLPSIPGSFVGRDRDIDELQMLLSDARLVTLTGPAGVGKTRLALEAVEVMLESFTDGAWLVELAPLDRADHVPDAVAAALGVREQAGQSLVATLANALRHRKQLLILDNCEHLVAACASLASQLLRECPLLRILATTREALRIAGETIWRVAPLSLPEADALAPTSSAAVEGLLRAEAVQLFLARTRAAMPDFQITAHETPAVARICRQLDGIPLALELAAARVPGLGLEQLARRLDDPFRVLVSGDRAAAPRQRTLRALLDSGYELLSEPERIMLRRCSVFSNSWTLDAAEGVCAGEEVDPGSLLPVLVDKSQVVLEERAGRARYRFLEVPRRYAAEKLRDAGEEAMLRYRHLEWFALWAEQAAEEMLTGADGLVWFDRLAAESDNLRAALAWSEQASADPNRATAAVNAGLRLGAAVRHVWDLQGDSRAARTRVLALLGTGKGDCAIRAKVMQQRGAPDPSWRIEHERRLAASPSEMPGELTRREGEVAALVAQGYTNRAIAEALVITERTAEGHVERIRGKLGFQSRAQVAVWAVRSNLLAA